MNLTLPGREHFLIEPFSTDLHGSTKYPFADMEVGDYFFACGIANTRMESVRQCARGWARRRQLDRKFSVRRVSMAEGQPPSRIICVRVR